MEFLDHLKHWFGRAPCANGSGCVSRWPGRWVDGRNTQTTFIHIPELKPDAHPGAHRGGLTCTRSRASSRIAVLRSGLHTTAFSRVTLASCHCCRWHCTVAVLYSTWSGHREGTQRAGTKGHPTHPAELSPETGTGTETPQMQQQEGCSGQHSWENITIRKQKN